MRLKVLDSGSRGNCYLLESEQETLIIELGLPWNTVLQALDFDTSCVKIAIVSHCHNDHSMGVAGALEAGVDVLTSKGTADSLHIQGHHLKTIADGGRYTAGKFEIKAFGVIHDAPEPLGFLVRHPESGVICFVTDSYFVEYKFQGVNQFIVECNYDPEILRRNVEAGLVPAVVAERVQQNHMSIDSCRDFLLASDLDNVANIVLIHLSKRNADPAGFQKSIQQQTGKLTHIARAGMCIDGFGIYPF
ncbi:MBL fold metallo-hydrolase [Dyadobacter sp. BHUBP1]|uniref:MBL fold metallo-hydrolase n=1 Tax=Dyadobacter sp. BHUBP1 TaxID=3424178 RepID=UPI003D3260CD